MTDVLLQLRSELVEEIISVAETFRQIPKDLLNSFLLSCRNHCCNIDSGFISFSTYFLFNLESFTIERERPIALIIPFLLVKGKQFQMSSLISINCSKHVFHLQNFHMFNILLSVKFSHYIQWFSIRKHILPRGYITICEVDIVSG